MQNLGGGTAKWNPARGRTGPRHLDREPWYEAGVSQASATLRRFPRFDAPERSNYKLVIYRNQPDGWVAEIPAIAGCHALMPSAEVQV